MRIIFTLCFFSFLINYTYSQEKLEYLDFNLYQYADARYRSLVLNLNQNSNLRQQTTGDIPLRSGNINLYGSLGYFDFQNTRRKQQVLNTDFNFNYAGFNSNYSGSVHQLSASGKFLMENRFYNELKFFEVNPRVEFTTALNSNSTTILSLGLRKGKGRLEPVGDVFLLLWILKDMQAEQMDLSLLGQSDVFEMSQKLNVIRNYRILDGRRQLKQQIKDLSTLVLDKTPENLPGLDVYSIVFDNYLGSIQPQRLEGKRWSVGINPFWQTNIPQDTDVFHRTRLELTADFIKSRNTSLYVQQGFQISGGAGIENTTQTESQIYPFARASYLFDWFPNSRTWLDAEVYATVRYIRNGLIEGNGFPRYEMVYNPGLKITANYFLNYKAVIQFGLSYDLNGYDNNLIANRTTNQLTNNFSFLYNFF